MDSKINSTTIKLFFDKLAILFNHFFLGMVILELFFKQGYFSDSPDNIYSFILFLVWSGIFSIPFHFFQPNSIENWKDDIISFLCKEENIKNEDFTEKQKKKKSKN